MKKAIINFFRAILRKNIVVKYNEKAPYTILNIAPDAKSLTEALGISEERANELGEACEKAMNDSRDIVVAMERVGVLCNHINEFFFCSVVINKAQQHLSNPIIAILGALGGPPPGQRPN